MPLRLAFPALALFLALPLATTARSSTPQQPDHLTFTHGNPTLPVCVEQQVDLRKSDDYLYLAVWDTATGRLGSLQVPVIVK